jgi:endonuclease YncB( thermonuclease family)
MLGTLEIVSLSAISAFSFISGIASHKFYLKHFAQIKTAGHLTPEYLSQRTPIRGLAVKVGDSDNFRVIHAPMGSLWLLRWKYYKSKLPTGSQDTIHVRLAGVDSPEGGFFGSTLLT